MATTTSYLEANRYLYIKSPLGPDDLLLTSFAGEEGLSRLFHFDLELLAENKTAVAFESLLGQHISFGVSGIDDQSPQRHFNGIAIRMTQMARDRTFTRYRATVVPDMWLLTQIHRNRIFQRLKTPDILQQVMSGLQAEYQIQGEFVPREYCVQYQETDFDFLSRLLEEEGIYYFFKFSEGKHTVVFANTPQGHPDLPGDPKINFEETAGGLRDEERIVSWQKMQSLHSGKYTVWDYHFELPAKHLDAEEQVIGSVAFGKATQQLQIGQNDKLEIYEYPGGYARYLDGVEKGGGDQDASLQKVFSERTRIAKVRMGQTEVQMLVAHGESNCRQLTSGYKFTLQRHYSGDGQYVLTEVWHSATEGSIRSDGGYEGEGNYQNSFSCIPFALPYRPARKTPRPAMRGCQTAVVVGPSGEEIYTDKYGRVKVQFQWDREGKDDIESSCWVRVSTLWAGNQWGMIHIPRIGQEVIVDFLEGNPDQPIITGSVYNANQMPPYTLPDNKTRSCVKSRSSLGGGGFNEFRFEDKKGSEQVFVHGEKDLDVRIKNDRREWIGQDRHLIVKRDRYEEIDSDVHVEVKRDHMEKIGRDRFLKVAGKQAVEITGSKSLKVTGDVAEEFGSNHSEKTTGDYYVHARNIVLEADVGLTINVGGNFVTINSTGVSITGTMVNINSGGMALKGSPATLVPPTEPKAPAVADDAKPGSDQVSAGGGSATGPAAAGGAGAASSAPRHDPSARPSSAAAGGAPADQPHFIEIELLDEEDKPVPGEPYEITLPDGTTLASGTTDEKGRARVENIDPGQCKIRFPRVDKSALERK